MGKGYYGMEGSRVRPVNAKYSFINDQVHLYELLCECWSADTCAPRMRSRWCRENATLGQCSITAFLTQDIFGGEVYGVKLPDGNYHCFNVVNGILFDLTSEQFGDKKLEYTLEYPQSREEHFSKSEKKERYESLKASLESLILTRGAAGE